MGRERQRYIFSYKFPGNRSYLDATGPRKDWLNLTRKEMVKSGAKVTPIKKLKHTYKA